MGIEAGDTQGERHYALRPRTILSGKGYEATFYPIPVYQSKNLPPDLTPSTELSSPPEWEVKHIPPELFDPLNHTRLRIIPFKPEPAEGMGHRVTQFISRIRQGRQPSKA